MHAPRGTSRAQSIRTGLPFPRGPTCPPGSAVSRTHTDTSHGHGQEVVTGGDRLGRRWASGAFLPLPLSRSALTPSWGNLPAPLLQEQRPLQAAAGRAARLPALGPPIRPHTLPWGEGPLRLGFREQSWPRGSTNAQGAMVLPPGLKGLNGATQHHEKVPQGGSGGEEISPGTQAPSSQVTQVSSHQTRGVRNTMGGSQGRLPNSGIFRERLCNSPPVLA